MDGNLQTLSIGLAGGVPTLLIVWNLLRTGENGRDIRNLNIRVSELVSQSGDRMGKMEQDTKDLEKRVDHVQEQHTSILAKQFDHCSRLFSDLQGGISTLGTELRGGISTLGAELRQRLDKIKREN